MKTLATLGLLVFLSLCAFGCSSGQPLPQWQQHLEAYVAEQGNGDPNALRELEAAPGRRGFSTIGAVRGGFSFIARTRSDVAGLLLATPQLQDQTWYVFLVGVTDYEGEFAYLPLDHGTVSDIRIAAMTMDGRAFRWVISDADSVALSAYSLRQEEQWKNLHPQTDPEEMLVVFPAADDQFELTLTGEQINVKEKRSAAHWSLPLNTLSAPPPR